MGPEPLIEDRRALEVVELGGHVSQEGGAKQPTELVVGEVGVRVGHVVLEGASGLVEPACLPVDGGDGGPPTGDRMFRGGPAQHVGQLAEATLFPAQEVQLGDEDRLGVGLFAP